MNSEYLGDSLDFYKRWFIGEFFPGEKLAAIPMLSAQWSEPDKALYSALLNVEVIQDELVPNEPHRESYFRPALNFSFKERDIFVDPDIGLRIGSKPVRRRYDEYLFGHELSSLLLPKGSRRAVIIYDQSISRGCEIESAEAKLRDLREIGLFGIAYCAQVALLIATRSRGRVQNLYAMALSKPYVSRERLRNTES